MALNLKIEQYEGPLDLLLALITKHKIDIFDIPISEICRQYMEYLESMKRYNMEVSAEFIYMASELMLIKSRMLLPKQEEAEDPRKELVDALLEHQRAQYAAQFFKERADIYYDRFVKSPEELDLPYERKHDVELLLEAFKSISERIKFKKEPDDELFVKLSTERWYTVEEKNISTMRFLYRRKKAEFIELFTELHSRNELCAVFLSVLELLKANRLIIEKVDEKIFLSLNKTHKRDITEGENI